MKENIIKYTAGTGATIIIAASLVWAIILIAVCQLMLWIGWLCRMQHHTYSVLVAFKLEDTEWLQSISDSWLVWYEKIAATIKNLVK